MVRSLQSLALAAIIALCAGTLASCGAAQGRLGSGAALRPEATAPDSANGPLTEPAEAYGLPPLDAVKQAPQAALDALYARSATSSWTVAWQARGRDGTDFGTVTIAHMPGRQLISADLGIADVNEYKIVVLDDGAGGRICYEENRNPWSCDANALKPALAFLSVDGFARIRAFLRDATASPGVRATERLVAGAPSLCFVIPAGPLHGDLGLDFSSGGTFCVANDGAPTKIDAGDLNVAAMHYTPGADPAVFRLPV